MNNKKQYTYDFPMAGNTVTMVLVCNRNGYEEILEGLRSDNSDAYPGYWSLPGGFLNTGTESLTEAASRETLEETGLIIHPDDWEFFYIDDKSSTDPRYDQIINICYRFHVTEEQYNSVVAGDDLKEVRWVRTGVASTHTLAFNHNAIMDKHIETN